MTTPNARRVRSAWLWIMSVMTSTACRDFDAPKDTSGSFASCCDGFGTCLPTAFLPDGVSDQLTADSCGSALMCVPDALWQSTGLQPCAATAGGGEGRCLPACLATLTPSSGKLSQDDCPANQLCAPCFEPIHGAPTGACNIGDDPGPARPASVFATCCADLGRCVPAQLVDATDRPQLARASCAERELCAPSAWVDDAQFVAASCVTRVNGGEGRCLPACLPSVAQQAARLFQDGCSNDELCTPCFDPLDGSPTGACSRGADPGPQHMPAPLPACCGELGRCVSELAVSELDRGQLARLECAGGALCAPLQVLEDPAFVPATCRAQPLGAEGRCLPACLPAFTQHALSQAGDCPAAHGCAPCFDPLDGTETLACTLGADPGPSEPAQVLATCCDGQGRCLPSDQVRERDRAQLEQAECESAALCAPLDFVRNPDFVPTRCTTHGTNAEGRCLPSCLPALRARADQLSQDMCPSGQLCAPCFDPRDGTATGACQLGADPGPTTQPVHMDACCDGHGRCVAESDVPASASAELAADSCKAPLLCSPAEYVEDASFVAQRCHDPVTHAEGRCLLACLPRVHAQRDRLGVDVCRDVERCVPCYDPVSGDATGACSLTPADAGPSEPKRVFESCCPASNGPAWGLCIPRALVPPDAPTLPRLTCPDEDSVCAPRMFATQDGSSLPTCTSLNTMRGACVPSCMIDQAQRNLVLQGSCAAETECVPCTVGGASTGACR